MNEIYAIGGAVIKTAWEEIKETARMEKIGVLIHNGASLFHDFQRATDPKLKSHSYPLEDLLDDFMVLEAPARLVWNWLKGDIQAPANTLTAIMEKQARPILMFTALGCDFWQPFGSAEDWSFLAKRIREDLHWLVNVVRREDFHFVCMGSAVIHPEIFRMALAISKPRPGRFTADVVDFLDMYRPRTRVARYGNYYQISHKDYLEGVISGKGRPQIGPVA